MRQFFIFLLPLLVLATAIRPAHAQSEQASNNFKQQFLRHFDYTSRILSLAKVMPAESYSWRPQDEVFSVADVYAHLARYNFWLLEVSLEISAPEGIDLKNMESLTDKQKIVSALEQSIEHVKTSIKAMPASKLEEETTLYGRTANGQAVLMQLITHYSEHAGQAIAYARMNDIVPPWNR